MSFLIKAFSAALSGRSDVFCIKCHSAGLESVWSTCHLLCGDAGDTINDSRETSPDLVQPPELGLFCQRAFRRGRPDVSELRGFVLCLLTGNSQGTAFVQETKLMEEPEGTGLLAPVDLGLFLTHPQEPQEAATSVWGKEAARCGTGIESLKLWFLCCNEH